MTFIKRIPTPILGLMLALGALGNLIGSYSFSFRSILGLLSLTILILTMGKFILYPSLLKEDLNNPVVASIVPTLSMGGMILATYLKVFSEAGAFYLWSISIILHILLIALYTKKFILKFNIKKIFPSIFIVYVGIVVASVTAPLFDMVSLGKGIFFFGFTSYLFLLPVVCYRIVTIKEIPSPAQPTLAILAAPGSLCLAGYLTCFKDKNIYFVIFLLLISITMYLIVFIQLKRLIISGFHPSFSAFTFPLVISAISTKLSHKYLSSFEFTYLNPLMKIQEIVAIIIVAYVLGCYLKFIAIPKGNSVKTVLNNN